MKTFGKICACSVPVFWALILFMASVADAELMPGDSLGSLKVETAEGGSLDLGDYGKSYILCSFVPGAGEQTEQLKNMEEILKREEFKDFELLVITRGIDAGEKKRAADYIARQQIKAVLLFEPELQAVKKFGVRTFPSFFVVDEKGVMKTLGIDSVERKIRKRTFEDFLENGKCR
ncbi:MAG: peroxiredoxin family protein [Desulfopila sp.]